jgi:hypothetical protein
MVLSPKSVEACWEFCRWGDVLARIRHPSIVAMKWEHVNGFGRLFIGIEVSFYSILRTLMQRRCYVLGNRVPNYATF